ncbi:LysR family transcriptional regulator [Pseudomonas aeruginosa VRFPA09]|nr:LysR family transcriptional regulator [Pseudomonas aeruginosa VRFPA09]
MALSFRQLQIFCAVARCGSTTAAAESISLSQSATSAALNELESQLSTRLFDRVGKRLQLNEVGRRFLPQALRLLDGVAQLEQQFAVSAAPQASLTVAASSTIGNYVLPRLLASFEREQPGVRVNASIGNTGSAVQDVVTFAADIGLIEGPCHEPGLRVEPWLEDSLIVVAAPGHPLALRTQVSREQIRTLAKVDSPCAWLRADSAEELGISARSCGIGISTTGWPSGWPWRSSRGGMPKYSR